MLTLALPAAALAGWLQFAGIDIHRDGGGSAVPTQPAPTSYEPETFGELGEPSTLDEVAGAASFEIVLPDLDSDESPDEVYLQQVQGATVVWLFYRDTPADSAAEGESLLVTELETPGTAAIDKILLGDTHAVAVEVHGELGAYVEGPQAITTDDGGGGANVPARLSTNSLIWQEGSITYRLEGALTQSQMLTIAASMAG